MFQLYKSKIILDKELINIEELSKLVDVLEKDKKGKDAVKLIMFIFLSIDRSNENPIRDLSLADRAREARYIAFNNHTFDIKKKYKKYYSSIKAAMLAYKENKVDSIQKDIDLYDKKMEQFIKLLDDNEPEVVRNTHELTGRVTFSTNIDIINTVLENSINIILDKSALVKMKKTGRFNTSLRGGLSPNTRSKLSILT